MEKIVFKCETITPMFIAGADGTTPELRAPSIKGAMRFWWRAVNGHLSVEDLRKREAEIFGGSGEGQGRSKVIVRVENEEMRIGEKDKEINKRRNVNTGFFRNGREIVINIFDYLGFGAITYDRNTRKNLIMKKYIDVGSKFNIIIQVSENYKDEVLKSLYLFFKYGNLGSKSRNGFGGINLINYNEIFDKKFQFDFLNIEKLPSYTAFFKDSVLFQTNENFDSWDKAMAKIGVIYREVRLSLEASHNYNERQFVALPLIAKNEKNITKFMQDSRSAKSYFLKVYKERDAYKGQILCLPSEYNYDNTKKEKSLENYKKMNKKIIDNQLLEVKNIND